MLKLIRIRAPIWGARFVSFSPQPSWTSTEEPAMHAASNHDHWKNQEPLAPATSSSARFGNSHIAIPYRRDDGARDRGSWSRSQQGGQTSISQTGDCLSISQDELQRYRALSIDVKEIRTRQDQLKESLVTAKPTASGRVTRRASSDPACIPNSGQGSESILHDSG
jgi:hypothetical protein